MLKKLMILPIAVGLLAVNAGAEEVVIPKNSDGCFEISTAEQLLAFSDFVNANAANKKSCAVLMNDIKFNKDFSPILNSGLTGLKSGVAVGDLDIWSPIEMFEGSFDGQGHSVSGLYYTSSVDAGFFASLSGYASVKNVRIEDSYFAADERVGGLAADIKTGAHVDIDQVSFSGIVTVVTTCRSAFTSVNGHMGGLIGTVSKGAEIINLSNSYNEGTVSSGNCSVYNDALGGLVGSVQDKESGKTLELNVSNCYNAGTVKEGGVTGSSPSIVGSKANGATINTENVGCTVRQTTYCPTTSSVTDLKKNYESRIEAQIQAALSNPENPAEGVEVGKDSESGKRIATLTLSDDETQVRIPQDILVDSIVLDRSFSTNRSTITLPFSISAENVLDAAGNPVTFSKLKNMVITDDNKWEIETQDLEVGAINAHTPYLVQASVGGPLTFKGSVTLKQTTDGVADSSEVVGLENGNWQFKGVYTKVHWDDDERAQEGCNECGRAYLFSSNKFVKVGKNGTALPYRAYLLAPEPFKPAVLTKAAAVIENPNEIAIRSLGSDANDFATVDVTFQKAEPIEVIESIENPEDETLAIKNPVMLPVKPSSNKWRDVKGRTMNHKPTAKGTYINNDIPVIVK